MFDYKNYNEHFYCEVYYIQDGLLHILILFFNIVYLMHKSRLFSIT